MEELELFFIQAKMMNKNYSQKFIDGIIYEMKNEFYEEIEREMGE